MKGAGKGLFGLCVAWHNADEKGKEKIAERFDARSDVPLSDIVGGGKFSCPCWPGLELDAIGEVTPPTICFLDTHLGDFATFGTSSTQKQSFLTDGIGCAYSPNYIDLKGNKFNTGTDNPDLGDAGQQCLEEMQQILDAYFDGGEACPEL